MSFQSYDRFIDFFNKNSKTKYKLIYSTPGQFLDAIKTENIEWPVKYDDMFPYADKEDNYWSGYYTSRANHKLYVRNG